MLDLPQCVADVLLFVQHAVIPRVAREAHIQKARADRLRLCGVRARVLVAVAAEYLPAVFHVHAQKSARREHQQCRDARRQIVRNIIRLCRHKADVLIRRLDVAEHRVHRIHSLVEKAQRRAADGKVQQRCDHAV